MKNGSSYESMLWKVLEKEGLVDMSQFHTPRILDEVPLYSRIAHIAFLSNLPRDDANLTLLRFSLKFLKSVISYEEHRTPFVAAISIWSHADDALLVPNLFVWSAPVSRMVDRLTLTTVKTRFAKEIKGHIARLRLTDQFDVLEDVVSEPGASRVFIGPSLPPYPNFVPLFAFRKLAVPVKIERPATPR
jgi:hypothetical protein